VSISSLVEKAKSLGITRMGITDHVNSAYSLDDIFRARQEFECLEFVPDFHFGVETSCVSEWELEKMYSGEELAHAKGIREGGEPGCPLAIGITEEDKEEYGIEYVIAGVHWPMYVPFERDAIIKDYQRQNMFLATHKLVDIIAHPWFWENGWQNDEGKFYTDPWLDDFGKIPLSFHDEFAAACKENNTAVEINLLTMILTDWYPDSFMKEYLDYLSYLNERGVTFAIGSDSHGPEYNVNFAKASEILEPLGLDKNKLWTLPPREENKKFAVK
jgi:histidinol phosphatase-like PHP family hydrolase